MGSEMCIRDREDSEEVDSVVPLEEILHLADLEEVDLDLVLEEAAPLEDSEEVDLEALLEEILHLVDSEEVDLDLVPVEAAPLEDSEEVDLEAPLVEILHPVDSGEVEAVPQEEVLDLEEEPVGGSGEVLTLMQLWDYLVGPRVVPLAVVPLGGSGEVLTLTQQTLVLVPWAESEMSLLNYTHLLGKASLLCCTCILQKMADVLLVIYILKSSC